MWHVFLWLSVISYSFVGQVMPTKSEEIHGTLNINPCSFWSLEWTRRWLSNSNLLEIILSISTQLEVYGFELMRPNFCFNLDTWKFHVSWTMKKFNMYICKLPHWSCYVLQQQSFSWNELFCRMINVILLQINILWHVSLVGSIVNSLDFQNACNLYFKAHLGCNYYFE